jgi:hypothetical protein
MLKHETLKHILLYTFVGVGSYLFTKKFFPEKPKSGLDVRGSNPTASTGILALILKDRATKIAIISVFGTIIGNELHQEIISILLKSSPAILAAPGDKIRLNSKVRRILQNTDLADATEILLDNTLTNSDKLEFLKIKVKAILKGLKGKKRIYFIMTLLSLLIFLFGNSTPAFTFFWANLRELFGATDLSEDLDQYIIEWYKEFNAPIPEELITKVIK